MRKRTPFQKLAWATLGYTLFVIVWGAYVRASGSGAGCGAHWPLCNGEVVPRSPTLKTLVELSHRLTSGVVLFFAIALVVAAFRRFPRGSAVRFWSVLVLLLTGVEALIGRALVLFELVAHNASLTRALSMVLHLGNTFLLLGAMVMAIHHGAAGAARSTTAPVRLPPSLRALFVATAAALMAVAMSGGIAALGDTLFPATSLAEGIRAELQTSAHVLLRLRVLHPLIAVATSLLVALTAAVARHAASAEAVRASRVTVALVVAQLALGLANVALLAPIWMQLVHLFVADVLWVAFVFLWAARKRAAVEAPVAVATLSPAA